MDKRIAVNAAIAPNKCAAPGRWGLFDVWAASVDDRWPTLDAVCSSSSSSSLSSVSSSSSSSLSSGSSSSSSSSAEIEELRVTKMAIDLLLYRIPPQ